MRRAAGPVRETIAAWTGMASIGITTVVLMVPTIRTTTMSTGMGTSTSTSTSTSMSMRRATTRMITKPDTTMTTGATG